jgi:hypothetical protein
MESQRRGLFGYISVAVVSLMVGYFAGREHVKYEMRAAFESATAEMGKGLANAFGVGAGSTRNNTKTKVPRAKPKESEPIIAKLVRKGFSEHDVQKGTFEDYITLVVTFRNVTGKDIRAFDGVLTFADLLDNEVLTSHVAINESVPLGGEIEWKGQLRYNQFVSAHQQLRGEQQQNLKISFNAKKLLFADGTTREFE